MVDINMCSNVNMCNNDDDFYLQVTNYGLYVARFSGSYTTSNKYVEFKSKDLYIGQFDTVHFPKDTKNISLKIEAAYFIETWIKFFENSYNFPKNNICIYCTGVSFFPVGRDVPCPNSLDAMHKQGLALQNDFLLNCYYKHLMCSNPPQLLNNNCNTVNNLVTSVNSCNAFL